MKSSPSEQKYLRQSYLRQRYLQQPVFRRGKGLHSGLEYGLSIEPSDGPLSLCLEGGEALPLSRFSLEGGGRGSDLIFPDESPFARKRVRTCEHVLSALAGMGVWRAKLTVSGTEAGSPGFLEMPGLDGCAEGLAREILEKSAPVGDASVRGSPVREKAELAPFRPAFPVHSGGVAFADPSRTEPSQTGTPRTDPPRFAVALPSPFFHVTCVIDYAAAPIGTRIFEYGGGPEDYLEEIAPARTFVMREDIEALRSAGLALGGSLDSAVVVDAAGTETAGGLRFPDEFVRHKVLDLLGDLACLGRPLAAHVIAVRAGHAQHLQLTEKLRSVLGGA
ncbi:MAG: UDP-3-O-acyl-N-acetylglucosamine deacetylase [Synergistaceae bacterium]|jgi:UDP-3-O-[3-hydroxymyristoyl] N-acetylglucosamine deacetylase|nr:UDP-3-O-acyl-N-acetylglucosamine deacetylase [Synergistaceae bacterium]